MTSSTIFYFVRVSRNQIDLRDHTGPTVVGRLRVRVIFAKSSFAKNQRRKMEEIFNTDDELPVYLKHQYQEGTATGLTVIGFNAYNEGSIVFLAQRSGRGSEGGNNRPDVQVPIHGHFHPDEYAST